MGMLESAEMPDLLNLPIYTTTTTREIRTGNKVHILHGCEVFGEVMWTHIEVWDPADLIQTANRCTEVSMRPKKQLVPAGH